MDRRPHHSPLPGAPSPGTSSRQQTFEGLPTLQQGFYPIQRHQVHPEDAPPWTSQNPVPIPRSESELYPQQDIYSTGAYQELPYASSEIPQHPYSSSRNDRDRMQGGQEKQQKQRVGRKRGRVPTSCTECRARKQRCDGAQPCLQCSKRQVDPSICRYEIDPRTTASREVGQEDTGPSGSERRKEKRRKSEAPRRDDGETLAHGMWNAPLAFSGGRFDDERRRAGDDGLARYQMTERNPRPPNLGTMLNDLSAYRMVGSGIWRPWDDSRSGMQQAGSLNTDLYGVQSAYPGSNSHHNLPPIIPPSPVLRPRSEADVRGDADYEGYERTKRNSAPKSSSSEGDASLVARRVRDLSPPGPQKEDSTARNAFKGNNFFVSDAAKMILKGPTTAAKEGRPQSDFDKAQSWSPENIKSRCLGKLPAKERCDELVQRYFDRFNSLTLVHQEDFGVLYDLLWYPPSHNDPPSKTIDTPFLSLLLIMVAFGCVPLPRAQNPVVTTDEGEPLILPPLKFDGHKAAADRHSSQIFMADGDVVLARRLYHASYQVFHLEASQGTLDTLRAGTLLIKFASLLGYRLEASSLVSYIVRKAQIQRLHLEESITKTMSRREVTSRRRMWAELYVQDQMAAMAHNIPAVIQESECTIQDPTLDLGTDESFPDFRSKEDRNQDSIAHLYSSLYRLVSRLRAENRTVEEAEEALSRFKQSIPKGYFVCSDQERNDQPTRIFVSTSFHYVRTTLHRGSLLLSVDPADGISEEELELRLRSRQACLESAVEEVRLRSKLGYSNDLHMITSGAGINTASIIAVALYQNVRHPFMSSSEVLGTLRTYLEYESRRSFLSEVNQDQLEVVFDLAESVTQAMRDMSTREASDNDAGTTGSRRGNTQSTDTLPSQRSFQATQTDMRPRHERLYQPRLNLPPHSSQLPTTGASSSSDLSMLINPMESAIHQSPLSYAPSQHYRHDLSSVSGSSMIRSPAPAWASQQVMSGSSSSSTPAFPRDGSRGSSRGSNTPYLRATVGNTDLSQVYQQRGPYPYAPTAPWEPSPTATSGGPGYTGSPWAGRDSPVDTLDRSRGREIWREGSGKGKERKSTSSSRERREG